MIKEYLGDGVYVEFNGYQIWLETQGEYATMRIALEPEVFENLLNYAERLANKQEININATP